MKTIQRKAVSPVIATVILVAVAITVSVGVSYWMSGISAQYTSFEKIEVQTATCSWDSTNGLWSIQVNLKNSGTATASLTNIFINDVEVNAYGSTGTIAVPPDVDTLGLAVTTMLDVEVLESGETSSILIFIDGPGGTSQWKMVSTGTTVNIKIHSSGGMDYIKLVKLA